MIEYQSQTNEIIVSTKELPQRCGNIEEQIKVDNYNSNCRYFLEIKCPKDKKYITKEINFVNNIGKIFIDDIITEDIGKIFVQLVIRNINGEIINKSLISKSPLYKVVLSINAVNSISNKSRNDCISFMINSVNEVLDYKKDLEKKVKEGYFNGKDGSVIKINNVEQHEINFIKNPQEQLNEKATKEQLNSLSMCPGTNFINNIFDSPTKWLNNTKKFIAPANGYIYVNFTTKNNEYVENNLLAKNKNGDIYYGCISTPNGYGKDYILSMPVIKDSIVELIIYEATSVNASKFISKFYYSEVK